MTHIWEFNALFILWEVGHISKTWQDDSRVPVALKNDQTYGAPPHTMHHKALPGLLNGNTNIGYWPRIFCTEPTASEPGPHHDPEAVSG